MKAEELIDTLKQSFKEGIPYEPGNFGEDYFVNPFPFKTDTITAEGSYLFTVEEGMLEIPFVTKGEKTAPSLEDARIMTNDRLKQMYNKIQTNPEDIVEGLIKLSQFNEKD